ncbi:NAD-dependent epimerase/dehydratase family protein [Nocardioides sp. GXZ039]|uniref:NAD-dependent epimerase/dehydratase family protein n=1 Tax=Nocardioides sp. GXZ039 TaxID=3136018 RepID=UPI0030F41BD9
MRIAVTGASGFCGSAVVRALRAHGHGVVALGRRPVADAEWRGWDAAADVPDLAAVEAVVHLAAAVGDPRPGADDAEFERVNVDGAARLLDAVRLREVPVVWVSSASVYDPRLDRSLVPESHPTEGGHLNAYGRTKALGDRLALAAGAVVLRPRAVYGPGDPHLLPRLRRAVRCGRIVLPGADVDLSLTHVDNLASACVAALGWPAGAYNVADPAPVRRDRVVAAVLSARVSHLPIAIVDGAARIVERTAALTGREPLLTPYAVDTLARPCCLDLSRARATGWEPEERLAGFVEALASR